MIKAIRYFAFSLIDSQSADAFVSRTKMNNALAFELSEAQVRGQQVRQEASDATWLSSERAGIVPLSNKDLDHAFEVVTKGDWIKAEILPSVYRRDSQFRHSARTHQWAPEYINPISFKVYIHRSGRMVSHSRPRIARECLEPAGQGGIIIGTIDELDTFYESNAYPEYEHPGQEEPEARLSIEETLAYCENLLSEVCRGNLEEPLEGLRYHKLDNPLLILKADQDASVRPLLAVYDAIETLNPSVPCLERFVAHMTGGESSPEDDASVRPWGAQWGSLQPNVTLSADQVIAVNASITMREGDVLAINGPPGTGKTAILKEIVASHTVRSVLAGKPAPLIAISSTNNQAIRNAMESLTKHSVGAKGLHQRWIPEVPGLAVYAVSQHGEALADSHNLLTMQRLDALEQTMDVNLATVKFCRFANSTLRPTKPLTTVEDACKALRKKLKDEAKTQAWISGLPKKLRSLKRDKAFRKTTDELERNKALWFGHHTVGHSLSSAWSTLETQLQDAATSFDQIREMATQSKEHINIIQLAWRDHPTLKRLGWARNTAWAQLMLAPTIRKALAKKGFNTAYTTATTAKRYYAKQRNVRLNSVQKVLKNIAQSAEIKAWIIHAERELASEWRGDWFWYALHIREGEWLVELRDTIRASDPDRRTHDKVVRRLSRHAAIAPVLIATLHRIPKVLSHWDIAKQSELPLFNVLDMLIIDEAGQSSPDVAASAIALTKRVILFGDRAQIEPLWSVSEREDIGNRVASSLLTKADLSSYKGEQFNISGGATSSGSALWMAQKATSLTTQGGLEPGLQLTINRRSVPAILELSNRLCYQGTLSSGRHENSVSPYPAIGMLDMPGQCREKMGSRLNQMEAMAIANWIANEKGVIEAAYGRPLSECLAVVTPFKAQADYLQARLDRQLGKDQTVTTGTIHSLQGAERPIIILSLAYTADAHPQQMFFDRTPTMLNVAASRAQDSFIVMGDLDTLTRAQNSAKVMAEYLQNTARPVAWAPWHTDMTNYTGEIWGAKASASLIQSLEENALTMALSDETISHVTMSTSALECDALQAIGNQMIKAVKRGCKVTLIVGQQVALAHPDADRISRGFDALQGNGVSIRYMPTVLSNRVCLSNGMALITPSSWFAAEAPTQVLLIQDDSGYELSRIEAAYNLDKIPG